VTRPEKRRPVNDVRMLSALAHPVRTALLSHLLAVGPRTASECAAAVDASPSNCSWHLRQLEKYGFVERAGEATDGRERPWRAAATGFRVGALDDTPAVQAALQTLASIQLDEEFRLARSYLRHEDELAEPWRHSAEFNTYGLLVDPAEMAELAERLDAAIRPYLAATRDDAPPDARPVHVFLSAFLRPDVL
jgi:DNA-binding transcriptional ArsR family regulator